MPDVTLEWQQVAPGVISFEDGTPIAGISVDLFREHSDEHGYLWHPRVGRVAGQSDASGRFRIRMPGELTILDWGPFRRDLDLPGLSGTDVEIEDTRASWSIVTDLHLLRVLVVDVHGHPLPGIDVEFERANAPRPLLYGTSDGRGHASFFLPRGTQGRLRVRGWLQVTVERAVQTPDRNDSQTVVVVPDPTDADSR